MVTRQGLAAVVVTWRPVQPTSHLQAEGDGRNTCSLVVNNDLVLKKRKYTKNIPMTL